MSLAHKQNEEARAANAHAPKIYDYADYRKFIKDRFDYLQSLNPDFSHRQFARQAGFSSPSILTGLTEGRRGLSDRGAAKVSRGLKLNNLEASFFMAIVRLSNCKSEVERSRLLEQIASEKRFAAKKVLVLSEFRYANRWFYPIVRELIVMGVNSTEEIFNHFKLKVSKLEVETCLKDLEHLKLVEHAGENRWKVQNTVVMTNSEAPSQELQGYYAEWFQQMSHILNDFDREQRDFRALTMAIDPNQFKEMKSEIFYFLQNLVKKFESNTPGSVVMQLNLQSLLATK